MLAGTDLGWPQLRRLISTARDLSAHNDHIVVAASQGIESGRVQGLAEALNERSVTFDPFYC